MMNLQASTSILSFIIIMLLSVVSSTPGCGLNDFSMCVPGPDCNRCGGLDCVCIEPKPSLTCNQPCVRPKTCVNGNCVCDSSNCPKVQVCQGDGTCGYPATISKPTDAEVANLTRFMSYCASSYCPNSATWTCGTLCQRVPQTTVIKTFTAKPDFWTKLFGGK